MVCVSSIASSVPCLRVSSRSDVHARLRQHHACVGQRRLTQHAGDIARLERLFECRDVVEFDHARGAREIVNLSDQARLADRAPAFKSDTGIIHHAVIAAVEDHDEAPPRDAARPAQDRPIGVARGLRHLPEGQAKYACQRLADGTGFLARQHARETAGRLGGKCPRDRLRGVAEHRAGIAETEIGIAASIDVDEMRALGCAHDDRKGRAPVVHPVHGNAPQPVRCALHMGACRQGVLTLETLPLAHQHRVDRAACDFGAACGHDSRLLERQSVISKGSVASNALRASSLMAKRSARMV